jgi:hypothetical protein
MQGDFFDEHEQALVAAVLAIAIGAPIAGFVGEMRGQSMTSTGVRVPFLHGFPGPVRQSSGPAAAGTSVKFRVLIDGQPPGAAHGIDVDEQGNGTITEQRLYQLIRQPKPTADRQFQIEFLDSGVEAYSFPFG